MRVVNMTCRECRFFNNEPAWLERALPGLNVLSSAYASVRAEAGICTRRDLFLSPAKACKHFEREPGDFSGSTEFR
jgi:hypothetical protein